MRGGGGSKPSVKCSPLKRRVIGQSRKSSSSSSSSGQHCFQVPMVSVVATGFKSSGVRRIVGQYSQMESELQSLRRRFYEVRHRARETRRQMKEQRAKSRKLIVSCAFKLEEKEQEMQKFQIRRREELATINRELLFLHSNLLKERQRLAEVVADKDRVIQDQREQIEALRKDVDRGQVDLPQVFTPASSLESSPEKPDQYTAPRFCIRPAGENGGNDDNDRAVLMPPPLPPPPAFAGRRRGERMVARRPPAAKAPVTPAPSELAFIATPPSPIRNDRADSSELSKAMSKLDVSDEDKENNTSGNSSGVGSGKSADGDSLTSAGDEGFSSSHESDIVAKPPRPPADAVLKEKFRSFLDWQGMSSRPIVSPAAFANHRRVTRPREVKVRVSGGRRPPVSLVSSDLAVLEEHQVFQQQDQQVAARRTVTYWRGPDV